MFRWRVIQVAGCCRANGVSKKSSCKKPPDDVIEQGLLAGQISAPFIPSALKGR